MIGGGAAGLRAAIEARRSNVEVLLVSKTPAGLANCTAYAGGGFQAPFGKFTPQQHFERTMKGGKFLNNRKLVQVMTCEAAARLLELREFGVEIETGDGTARVKGPFAMNGTGLTLPLLKFARELGVTVMENVIIASLEKSGESVVGAAGFNRLKGEVISFSAKSVVLCSGGAGQIYMRTDNPVGTTGEGYAIAYDAGARLIDMEFVQFFPFGLVEPGCPMFLFNPGIVEAGRLLNVDGKEFLREAGFSPGRDFVEHRDALSRMICMEIERGKGDLDAVLLDLSGTKQAAQGLEMLGEFKEIKRRWLSKVDLSKKCLHIAPLQHYFMGGIDIDVNGGTNVPGLYAAGEVTGGVDGANRLGGNALTNTIVFGSRAGKAAAEYAKHLERPETNRSCARAIEKDLEEIRTRSPSPGARPREIRVRLRTAMTRCVGVLRSQEMLESAYACIQELTRDLSRTYARTPWELGEALEVRAMLAVAEIVTRCAMERKESRGAHYRLDYPNEDPTWFRNLLVERSGIGMMIQTREVAGAEP